jgi:hypothetical protein
LKDGLSLKVVQRDVRGAGTGDKVQHARLQKKRRMLIDRWVPEMGDGHDPIESLCEAALRLMSDQDQRRNSHVNGYKVSNPWLTDPKHLERHPE